MNIIRRVCNNKTIRNGGLFSVYSFVQSGVSFILLIILAKFITPSEYGLMSLFNTATMFFSYFVGLNTAGYLSVSYFANKDFKEFKIDFTIIILLTITSTILLFIIILPFLSPVSKLINTTPLLLTASLLIATFRIIYQILLNYYRVQEKVVKYGIFSCSNSLLSALLVFILVLYCGQGWYGYVEGQFISLILFAIIALLSFKNWDLYSLKGLTIQRFKNIIFWGVPLIPHLAAIWIRQGMDRYIIEHNHSTIDVGFFSFALNLTNIIIMVGTAFNNTLSVNMFKTLALKLPLTEKTKKLNNQSKKIIIVYVMATITIVLGVVIFVPLIMPNYSPSIKYFIILSLYGLCQCFYFQYCNYFFYFKKTRTLMYITFGSSLLHLFLSFLLTPHSLIITCCIYVIIQALIATITKHLGLKLLKHQK